MADIEEVERRILIELNVSRNRNLLLNLSSYRLTGKEQILKKIQYLPHLQVLYLSNNNISDILFQLLTVG